MPAIEYIELSSEPVGNPDSGWIYRWADSTTGKPKAKNSSGTVYDFVGPAGSTGATGPVGPTGAAGPAGPGSILSYATSSTFLQNQSSTVWADYGVTITYTPPSAGTYDLQTSYVWSLDDTGQDFQARFSVNGTFIEFHRQEPKDKEGGGDGGTDQRYPASYSEPVTLTSGANTLKLQFKGSVDNKKAAIHMGSMYIRSLP